MVSKASFADDDFWRPVGRVISWRLRVYETIFELSDGNQVRISFAANQIYRLRFNPDHKYRSDESLAIIQPEIAPDMVSGIENGQVVA